MRSVGLRLAANTTYTNEYRKGALVASAPERMIDLEGTMNLHELVLMIFTYVSGIVATIHVFRKLLGFMKTTRVRFLHRERAEILAFTTSPPYGQGKITVWLAYLVLTCFLGGLVGIDTGGINVITHVFCFSAGVITGRIMDFAEIMKDPEAALAEIDKTLG